MTSSFTETSHKSSHDFVAECTSLFGDQLIQMDSHASPLDDGIDVNFVRVKPLTEAQVVSIVSLARKYSLTLYPISCGKNWGYGSASPSEKNNIILDLSKLNSISFDEETGIVEVGPGVTQESLHSFLQSNNYDYYVPVTGAGLQGSILGNALERGYGITPFADHFAAVTRLKVLLPDGSIIENPFSKNSKINSLHKYGLGPSLDPLFTQSSFGIVLKGSILLKKRMPHTDFILIRIDDEDVARALNIVTRLHHECGSLISSLNIMDDARLCASGLGSNFGECALAEDIRQEVQNFKKGKQFASWNIIGSMYTNDILRAPTKKLIKKICREEGGKVQIVGYASSKILSYLSGLSIINAFSFGDMIKSFPAGYDLLHGVPNDTPLGLLRNFSREEYEEGMDLSSLHVGLRWLAPLIPAKADDMRFFVEHLRRLCYEKNVIPLITLTCLDQAHFDASIPFLYHSRIDGEKERIEKALDEITEFFIETGFEPYRLGVKNKQIALQHMDETHWDLIRGLKEFFDPEGIIADGKYIKD